MKKTNNNKTRANKVIRLIGKGGTLEQGAEALGLSVQYTRSIVKAQYKNEKAYNNLLAKSRANKKAQEEAKALLGQPSVTADEPEQQKEVIVVETGYLMYMGIDALKSENLDIYVPHFCIKELEKLMHSFAAAEEALKMYYGTRTITPINLRGKEDLLVDPTGLVRERSKGVVAVCCDLWSTGYKVKLLTNSREIEELADLQGIDITVARVKKSQAMQG